MKRLQFLSIRYSYGIPKGRSFAELTEKDIKSALCVKRVFSPRLANNLFGKKQKIT
ncbi:MAG: hypothetical protein NC299_10855 [Lachnospiraceae bacterium]|nr:hypothetical protein [Ruminococcus sp.]MCM1275847.1 hypothetical protein [Lachnospiraceae bacterium]